MRRALALVVVALLAGCASAPGGPATPAPPAAPARGVAFSPASLDGPGVSAFFDEAKRTGNLVAWGGDWMELAKPGSGADVVATLGAKAGLQVLVEAAFFQQRDGKLLRPLDEANRTAYRDAAASFARSHRVAFLGLGLEVDILHEKDPASFDAFAAWYPEAYAAVKAASPSTLVFPVFQHERLAGLRGGLYGDASSSAPPAWDLLDRFPQRDLDAFTTYPSLLFASPEAIPADLYANLTAHATKPLAFTETGWPSAGDPAAQARYVRWLAAHAPPARLAVWLALHDPPAPAPFDSMGLVEKDGTPRAAYAAWRSFAGVSSG